MAPSGAPRSPLPPETWSFGPEAPGPGPEGPHPRTAARLEQGRLLLAEAHLARLLAAMPETAPWLPSAFDAAHAALPRDGTGLVRLALTPGARRLVVALEPLPPTPAPYRLRPLPHPLPPHPGGRAKGLDGPWSKAMLARAQAAGAEDALLHWPDGTLAETAIAAVVLVRGTEALVPPPGGRVLSLGERHLLPAWARDRGLQVREAAVRLEDVATGTLWCVNAVRGLWQAECLPPLPPMKA